MKPNHRWSIRGAAAGICCIVAVATGGCPVEPETGPQASGPPIGSPCPGTLKLCDAVCVDPLSDPLHCGGCGNGCDLGAVCQSGACQEGCDPAFVDCEGACVDLTNHAAHCGGCGNSCGNNHGCIEGQCHCLPDCAGRQCGADGCGGICGPGCAEGETCVEGRCQHLSGDCNSEGCGDGTYCDLATGACLPGCAADSGCPADEVCDPGQHACVCGGGTHRCDGVCVSGASLDACGASCEPCPTDPHGSAVCDGARCTQACDPGYVACGPACCSAVWVEGTIDEDVASDAVAVATDSAGHLHALYDNYSGPQDNALRYAVTDGDGWATETIETSYQFVDGLALAIDGDDEVHAVFTLGWDEVRYAHRGPDGFWDRVEIDRSTGDSQGISHVCDIAVSAAGVPHLCYAYWSNIANDDGGVLRYATRDAGGWRALTVDIVGNSIDSCTIALDAAGGPVIAYVGSHQNVWGQSTLRAARGPELGDITVLASPSSGADLVHVVARADSSGAVNLVYSEAQDFGGDSTRLLYMDLAGDAAGRDREEILQGELRFGFALSLTASGVPCVGYPTAGTQAFACRGSQGWSERRVDPPREAYPAAFAAVTPEQAHFVYPRYEPAATLYHLRLEAEPSE